MSVLIPELSTAPLNLGLSVDETNPAALSEVAKVPLGKTTLTGYTLEELTVLMKDMGEPAFRAKQLHQWIYVKCARSFEEMTDLSKAFREKLSTQFQVGGLRLAEKQCSQDGTIKYLFQLPTGEFIESVLMYFSDRDTHSLCISSQVGCAVNCQFCATGKIGFKRQLSRSQITEQYLFAQHDSGAEIRNIVFMGQGEPLLNYDEVLGAIRLLNQSAEVGIRHITVSTSGIIPQIDRLAAEDLQLVLAVSLHAPDDETRSAIMPINQKWPVKDLIAALHRYVGETGRRITIEYVLLANINDSAAHAHKLGQLLKKLKCNVNLIPYNPIGQEYGYERPSLANIETFHHIVSSYGKKVTTRVERGVDIDAACGQLANKKLLSAGQ